MKVFAFRSYSMIRNKVCAMRRWADKEAEDILIKAKELSLVEKKYSKS